MIPRYKDFSTGVNCGSNCLRRALKNSAPCPCKFEFAYSVISTNNNSGSFSGATLFTDFKYSKSALCRFVEGLSPLRRTIAAPMMSSATHNSSAVRKRVDAFISIYWLKRGNVGVFHVPQFSKFIKLNGISKPLLNSASYEPRAKRNNRAVRDKFHLISNSKSVSLQRIFFRAARLRC